MFPFRKSGNPVYESILSSRSSFPLHCKWYKISSASHAEHARISFGCTCRFHNFHSLSANLVAVTCRRWHRRRTTTTRMSLALATCAPVLHTNAISSSLPPPRFQMAINFIFLIHIQQHSFNKNVFARAFARPHEIIDTYRQIRRSRHMQNTHSASGLWKQIYSTYFECCVRA